MGQLGRGELYGHAQSQLDGALGDLGALARGEQHPVQLALHVGVDVGLGEHRGFSERAARAARATSESMASVRSSERRAGRSERPARLATHEVGSSPTQGRARSAHSAVISARERWAFFCRRLPPRRPVDDAQLVARQGPASDLLGFGRLLGDHRLDGQGAPGELGHQVGGHAVDLALGHPAGDGPGLRPGHPEALRHEVLDQADVALGQGHHPGVQGPAVQGAPPPVGDGLGSVPNHAW